MDDPPRVSRLQGRGDLAADLEGFPDPGALAFQELAKGLSRDELHDEEPDPVLLLELVERGDVRVVQRREEPGLALEARQPARVARDGVRQDLDGDPPPEASVARMEDFAHPAGSERSQDLVRPETGSRSERHRYLACG